MTTETVQDVVRDFDAMATECGGLEAATIHVMTLRLSAAHAREIKALLLALNNEQAKGIHTCNVHCECPLYVAKRQIEALCSDLSDYMQAADAEAARSDKLAVEVEALRQRAEAAEGTMRTIASTHEGRMAMAKAIHIELDKVDAWLDAAIGAERG